VTRVGQLEHLVHGDEARNRLQGQGICNTYLGFNGPCIERIVLVLADAEVQDSAQVVAQPKKKRNRQLITYGR
jgi:hypothetical protein